MRLTILGVLLRFIRSGIGERSIETRLKYIGGVDRIMRYEEGLRLFWGRGSMRRWSGGAASAGRTGSNPENA